jgi:hypothetical protein
MSREEIRKARDERRYEKAVYRVKTHYERGKSEIEKMAKEASDFCRTDLREEQYSRYGNALLAIMSNAKGLLKYMEYFHKAKTE